MARIGATQRFAIRAEHGLRIEFGNLVLAQLSQLERLTGIFWGFADENGSLFKGWLLEIACSEDQAPFQGRGLA
jgi:hypothetical protein